MSEFLEKQKREEQRLEAEKLQKKQLFAQRVAAAASVATAASAAQTAAEVERMRREASAAAEATARHQRMVEIQQAEMAARQEQMAEDQRVANFRQSILTTLPLLKDGEKSQYLIEQLLPGVEKRYKNEVGDKVFGDILKVFKFPDFAKNYFATEPDVKEFMIEGKNPKQKTTEATIAYEKTDKELRVANNSRGAELFSAIFAYVIAALLQFCFYFYFIKLLVLPSLKLSNPEWTVDYIFYPVSALASLVLSISVFKNAKKEFAANRIKKVSDLSNKLFL